jgi:hypothetical protein
MQALRNEGMAALHKAGSDWLVAPNLKTFQVSAHKADAQTLKVKT